MIQKNTLRLRTSLRYVETELYNLIVCWQETNKNWPFLAVDISRINFLPLNDEIMMGVGLQNSKSTIFCSLHTNPIRKLSRRCLADFKERLDTYESVSLRSFVKKYWDLGWRKPKWPKWPKFAISLTHLTKTLANLRPDRLPHFASFDIYISIQNMRSSAAEMRGPTLLRTGQSSCMYCMYVLCYMCCSLFSPLTGGFKFMTCATCNMDRPPYRYGGQVNKNKNKDGDIDMAVRLSLQYNLFLGHDAFIKLAVSQRMGGATLQEVPPTLKKEQGVSLGCTLWFIVANEERARN